jgi:nitrogen fixation protein FixH
MSRRRLQQFFPGETVRVRVSFSDDADVPVTVSGVGFSVRTPSGTVTSSPAVQVDASTYYTDVSASVAGDWAVRATASAPSSSAVEVQFSVAPSLVLA